MRDLVKNNSLENKTKAGFSYGTGETIPLDYKFHQNFINSKIGTAMYSGVPSFELEEMYARAYKTLTEGPTSYFLPEEMPKSPEIIIRDGTVKFSDLLEIEHCLLCQYGIGVLIDDCFDAIIDLFR